MDDIEYVIAFFSVIENYAKACGCSHEEALKIVVYTFFRTEDGVRLNACLRLLSSKIEEYSRL